MRGDTGKYELTSQTMANEFDVVGLMKGVNSKIKVEG